MDFTPAQHTAIHLPDNLVVTASAGSGKTRVLVERYLRLFCEYGVDAVLAVTFTEKAAREMRERVRHTVEARARAAPPTERLEWEERRTAVEAARIGTIHSFCATLLRAHPAETGLDPRFAVLDEVEAGMLLASSIDEALGEAVQQSLRAEKRDTEISPATEQVARPDPRFSILEEFGLDELRGILTGMLLGGAEVRAALHDLPATPQELLDQWGERRAAARAAAYAELRAASAWREASDTLLHLAPAAPPDDRIGAQVRAVAGCLAALGDDLDMSDLTTIKTINLQGGSKKAWGAEENLSSAKAALRTLRDSYATHAPLIELALDEDLESRAVLSVLSLRLLYAKAWTRYTAHKEQQDVLDFDDLERRTRDLLEQHPHVRTRWQNELRAVLVDEFQDTNDEQRAIIYALAGLQEMREQGVALEESLAQSQSSRLPLNPHLFVVGDGKQSIYRFRGADVSVFRTVANDITASTGKAVSLDTSFRSHQRLVNWINQLGQAIFTRAGGERPYEFPYEPLQAHRPEPPHPHCVELHVVAGENADARRSAEARLLAERIKDLVAGEAGPIVAGATGWRKPEYGDFALLFQASTVFDYYEQAFRELGVPYLTTAGRGYYGRKEVQDLIHLLRALDDPSDELALVGVLRSPLFALDDATILRLRFANSHSLWQALMELGDQRPLTEAPGALAVGIEEASDAAFQASVPRLAFARETLHDLQRLRGRVTVVELLRATLAATGYLATISGLDDGDRRRANVEKLIEAARKASIKGLSAFREYLERLLQAEPREGEAPLEAEGSVQLMTVHRSKGLEFPIVALPDLGRRNAARPGLWLARRAYGLALQLRGSTSDLLRPVAYQLALDEEQRMERAERERLLYVALTRAKDYLILCGPAQRSSTQCPERGDDWFSWLLGALGLGGGDLMPGDYDVMRVYCR
jgi:ATP-dependent helicase/nuclease subunit A